MQNSKQSLEYCISQTSLIKRPVTGKLIFIPYDQVCTKDATGLPMICMASLRYPRNILIWEVNLLRAEVQETRRNSPRVTADRYPI